MRRRKAVRLKLFRYQLLPLSQTLQTDFVRGISSLQELRDKKNTFFADSLRAVKSFEYRNLEIVHKVDEIQGDQWFFMRIASRRHAEIETKEFQQKLIDTWPHIVVIINNDPNVQKIAISENRKAFTSSGVVINAIVATLNALLRQSQLSITVEPLFEEHVFWDLVQRHRGKVLQASFDLISPNLANITRGLKIDLGMLQRDTNTRRTRLQLNSEKDAVLELNQNSEILNSIVAYAAQGGGDISLRVRGMKRKVSTKTEIRETSIQDMTLEGLHLTNLKDLEDLL